MSFLKFIILSIAGLVISLIGSAIRFYLTLGYVDLKDMKRLGGFYIIFIIAFGICIFVLKKT